MAIKRPAPKTISAEASQALTNAFAAADGKSKAVKSYDPQNFPVFEVPVNQKVLAYIPNHVVTTAMGTIEMRMDKFPAHPVIDGRSFGNIRCISGITSDDPQLNYDGTCPLCDAMTECWDLANKQYADVAASRGMSVDAPEAKDALKSERSEIYTNRIIKEAEIWYTFPIVVIDCEEKDGIKTTTPKVDANGQLSGTVMWYSIRERTFQEKWVAGYDSLDGEIPTSPAGLWAVLNFTYQPKSGKPDKMGSAKALKVTFKSMENLKQWALHFDKLTEAWTPEKAQEVVVLDVIRSMSETQEVADSLMKPVREKLALYQLGAATAPQAPAVGSADATLSQFGISDNSEAAQPAQPVAGAPVNITGEMPNVGVQ